MKTIAAILAAGKGLRAGFPVPKQLAIVAGKPLVRHSLKRFNDSSVIEAIIIVTSDECMEKMHEIVLREKFAKVAKIIEGGKTRSDSSFAAIRCCRELCGGEEAKLLLHDAARPLVTDRMIEDVARSLDDNPAATIAVPASDTIAVSDGSGAIRDIPDRRKMYVLQTPQAFRFTVLERAYALAANDPDFAASDDCGVVRKYLPELGIALVENPAANIKLTYPEDLPLLEKLLETGDFK